MSSGLLTEAIFWILMMFLSTVNKYQFYPTLVLKHMCFQCNSMETYYDINSKEKFWMGIQKSAVNSNS